MSVSNNTKVNFIEISFKSTFQTALEVFRNMVQVFPYNIMGHFSFSSSFFSELVLPYSASRLQVGKHSKHLSQHFPCSRGNTFQLHHFLLHYTSGWNIFRFPWCHGSSGQFPFRSPEGKFVT